MSHCDDCQANMFANEVLFDIKSQIKETRSQKIQRISRELEQIRKDLEMLLEEED